MINLLQCTTNNVQPTVNNVKTLKNTKFVQAEAEMNTEISNLSNYFPCDLKFRDINLSTLWLFQQMTSLLYFFLFFPRN